MEFYRIEFLLFYDICRSGHLCYANESSLCNKYGHKCEMCVLILYIMHLYVMCIFRTLKILKCTWKKLRGGQGCFITTKHGSVLPSPYIFACNKSIQPTGSELYKVLLFYSLGQILYITKRKEIHTAVTQSIAHSSMSMIRELGSPAVAKSLKGKTVCFSSYLFWSFIENAIYYYSTELILCCSAFMEPLTWTERR